MLGWCCLREAFRMFRLERIIEVQPSGKSFRPGRAALLRRYLVALNEHDEVPSRPTLRPTCVVNIAHQCSRSIARHQQDSKLPTSYPLEAAQFVVRAVPLMKKSPAPENHVMIRIQAQYCNSCCGPMIEINLIACDLSNKRQRDWAIGERPMSVRSLLAIPHRLRTASRHVTLRGMQLRLASSTN